MGFSILCGASSKEKSSDFFQELEEERLPSRIVLKTSAYYSGFDLNEQYHLILAIVTSDYLNILSDKRVTQIAGRARNGLLSETIVLNFSEGKNKSQEGYTLESLKKIAETQIQVYQCIESNFNGNQILKERIKESFDAILNKTKIEGYGLVNLNNEKPRISYLGIDAILEAAEAKTELYSSRKGLLEKLKNSGHHVKMMEANSGTKISSKIDDDELEVDVTVYNMFSVEQVMARNLVKVSTDTTIKEVAEILSKREFHALPVVLDDLLVGIVTTTDLIKYLIDQY
jgi:CBS domain-containing protein